jgi:hypothetical protein
MRQTKGRWRQVIYHVQRHGYIGWVYDKYLAADETPPREIFQQARLARATGDARLRQAPGPEANVLAPVRRDTHLKLLNREGQWCRVVSENGLYGYIGWVRRGHLSDAAPVGAEGLRRGLICTPAGEGPDVIPAKPMAAGAEVSAVPAAAAAGRAEKRPLSSTGRVAAPKSRPAAAFRAAKQGLDTGAVPKPAARAQAMAWTPAARLSEPDILAGGSIGAADGADAGPPVARLSVAAGRNAQWERSALRLCLLVMAGLGCVMALGTWRQVHRMRLSPDLHPQSE